MTDPNNPDHNDPNNNDPNNDPDNNTGDDDWANAMSEQQGNDAPENSSDSADPWAEALAEQEATEGTDTGAASTTSESGSARAAGDNVFQPLEQGDKTTMPRDLEMIMDIPVKLTVELGRTRLTIKQLLELAQGSVIELEGLAGEPMDILINNYLIAQGEVVVVEDKYGIRITEIITPSERVQKLNR